MFNDYSIVSAQEDCQTEAGVSEVQAHLPHADDDLDETPCSSAETQSGDAPDEIESQISDAPSPTATDDPKVVRKRYTIPEQNVHRMEIITAHEKGEPHILIQRRLGLSKVQFKNYLADLYVEGLIQGLNENHGICAARHIFAAIKRHFPGMEKETLISVQGDSSGVTVTLCA